MRAFAPLAFLCLLTPLGAQSPATSPRSAVGFHLANLDGDPAVGLEGTRFLSNALGLRASLDLAQHRGLPTGGAEETSAPFGLARMGVVGVGGVLAGYLRLYGEGGVLVARPSERLSAEGRRWGGYGHFGFEFLFDGTKRGPAYFLELGTVGSDARAGSFSGRPHYLNGFATRVGFRLYF